MNHNKITIIVILRLDIKLHSNLNLKCQQKNKTNIW